MTDTLISKGVALLIAVSFFAVPRAWSADGTRILLLQMPAKDSYAVRAELDEPTKSLKPEVMEQMVKSRNLVVLADFKQSNPWRSQPVELEKSMGVIESGGEMLEFGVKLRLEGFRESGAMGASLNAELTLPKGGKNACFFQAIGSTTARQPSRWHERCCWGDGKETLMLWEYPVVEAGAQEEPAQKSSAVHVEMRWFQTSEADMAKLAASKPDTREKALQWLTGRAKLWQEAGYGFKAGNPSVWQMSQGKFDPEKDASISDESFILQTKCREEAGKLKMNWTMSITKKGSEKSTDLKADMDPGIWEFLPVEGNPDANVIACRVTKP